MGIKRKVFVSYHHDSGGEFYKQFTEVFAGTYQVVTDNSVERFIDSDDSEYVMRRIRENYLTGSSVTIVLCGQYTWGRKYVDWEILASLNQQMGLVGVNLPTNPVNPNGKVTVPDRLHDNIQSGYAEWTDWNSIIAAPSVLLSAIESSLVKDKRLIDNTRARLVRNASTS